MQFKIDLKIFLFVILFYFTGQIRIYALILIFALIHELGHLLAGVLLGLKPSKLELKPYGVSISFMVDPKSYNKKILNGNLLELKKVIIAAAGPFTNFIIIFIIMGLNLNFFTSLLIIYSNVLLIIFNLIPIYPLDGGRILKSLIHIFSNKKNAEICTNIISFIILIIVSFLGSITTLYMKNISIFFIVIFLWIIYIKEDITYRRKIKIYNLIEKNIEKQID